MWPHHTAPHSMAPSYSTTQYGPSNDHSTTQCGSNGHSTTHHTAMVTAPHSVAPSYSMMAPQHTAHSVAPSYSNGHSTTQCGPIIQQWYSTTQCGPIIQQWSQHHTVWPHHTAPHSMAPSYSTTVSYSNGHSTTSVAPSYSNGHSTTQCGPIIQQWSQHHTVWPHHTAMVTAPHSVAPYCCMMGPHCVVL